MIFTNKQANPKDFQDFEDYKKALKIHKEFMDNVDKISEIIDKEMAEEEEKIAMEELGFTYHNDFICERDFCQKHGECLSNILYTIQWCINDDIFGGLLANNDNIFARNNEGYFDFLTCDDLPKSWFDDKSKEKKIIDLYLQIEEFLMFDNLKNVSYTELIKDEKIRQFVESLYFLLQMILRNKNQIKIDKNKQIVLEFLKNNDVLNKKLCIQLSTKLENI